ncbi:MAG: response regulator transcription factor [Chloroflexota bacterium]
MQLLVVEDDRRLADTLRRGLGEEGHAVDVCADGAVALSQVEAFSYDGIVLDVMLPNRNGFEVCKGLRSAGIRTPVLMLTARDTLDDIVRGLEAGADDYLVKPFAFRELRARLQAIMRRAGGSASSEIQAGDLVLDLSTRQTTRGGQHIRLTNREYQLLEYLMHNPGRVLTRSMIEEHVWGYDYAGFSNTVDVHIQRLRRKLDVPGHDSLIETVRGAGYRLVAA